jgi:Integrase zinc binding domain
LEWLQSQGLLYFYGKIYVPDSVNLQRQTVFLCHDTKIAGHCGRWKTLESVSRNYWWPQMSRYIGKYIFTCDMCLRTKAFRQPPIGELRLLPVPDAPWDVVSVDFISKLNGKDFIMVVVDSVMKRSHFVDTVTTIFAIGSTRLYVKHIWKHHGLPGKMLSDRGPQFVVEFMKELYCLLGIKLAATTAYHPQGDRQTEQVNQELEQYFCLFVNQQQDNWDELLHLWSFSTKIMFILLHIKFHSCWILAGFLGWDLNPDNTAHIWKASMSSRTK